MPIAVPRLPQHLLAVVAVALLAGFGAVGVTHHRHQQAAERRAKEQLAREAQHLLDSLTPEEVADLARALSEQDGPYRYTGGP